MNTETRLTMRHLDASTTEPIVHLRPDSSLLHARTLMELHGFSQLPVVHGKGDRLKLKGVVTWESIARALLSNPHAQLADCVIEKPPVASLSDDLLPTVARIGESGFVIVVDARECIKGIVTSADVGDELVRLAQPYLHLAECERRLRDLVRSLVSVAAIAQSAVDSIASGDAETDPGIDGLPLGVLVTLIQSEGASRAIARHHDPKALSEELALLVAARNRVMHFRDLDEAHQRVLGRAPALSCIIETMSAAVLTHSSAALPS